MIGHIIVAGGLRAGSVVLAWVAVALVDIYVAVTAQRHAHRAFLHVALSIVQGDVVVVADAVGEPSHASALVCVDGNGGIDCGVRAGGTILTRAAGTLVDIDVAVATVFCAVVAFCHRALCRILRDKATWYA